MSEPTEGGVDAPAAEGNGDDITTTIAEVVKSQLAEVLAPLREDVEAVRRNKLDSRNKKLNDEIKARDEKISTLEAQLKKLSPETVATKDEALSLMRQDLAAQIEQTARLQKDFAETQSKLRRKELEDLVLGDVAPEHRETALDLMEGTLRRKQIDINETEDIASVAEMLRERIQPTLSIPRGKSDAKPSSVKADVPTDPSRVDWEAFGSWAEIPIELRPHVPDEIFDRIVPGSQSGAGGFGT